MRREKRGLGRFLRMKTVLTLNLAVLGMVVWAFSGEYVRGRELQEEIESLKQAAEDMEQANIELADMRERFSGDGQLEREARTKLNLMLPGEQVVVIKEGEPVQARLEVTEDGPAGTVTHVLPRPSSNASKWFTHLFRLHGDGGS